MLRQRDLMMIEHEFDTLFNKGLYPDSMTPIDKGKLQAVKSFGESLLEEVKRLNKVVKSIKIKKRRGRIGI